MWRRWIIRSVFVFLLLLWVGGWGWSMGHNAQMVHFHAGVFVSGGTREGTLYSLWGRTTGSDFGYAEGWSGGALPGPVQLLPPNSFEPSNLSFLGFRHLHITRALGGGMSYDGRIVAVPYWFLILLSTLALLIVWRKTAKKQPAQGFPVEMAAKEGQT